jgi:hypothetical protein
VKKSRYLRISISTLAVVVCCLVAGCAFIWQPVWLYHWRDFRKASEVISRVEAFRKSHRSLPETLDEVGMADPDLKVFYRRNGDTQYYVWFGTTLGESETYDSQTKRWE